MLHLYGWIVIHDHLVALFMHYFVYAPGGDTPEAVADALHQVKKLQWRNDSTKICVFIADAPPHGLSRGGDHFPNGRSE